MTNAAVSRIKSATAKANNGAVPKGSFAARAESASVKNTAKVNVSKKK